MTRGGHRLAVSTLHLLTPVPQEEGRLVTISLVKPWGRSRPAPDYSLLSQLLPGFPMSSPLVLMHPSPILLLRNLTQLWGFSNCSRRTAPGLVPVPVWATQDLTHWLPTQTPGSLLDSFPCLSQREPTQRGPSQLPLEEW